MLNKLIARRYKNNGFESLRLAPKQRQARKLICNKIKKKVYKLEKTNCPSCASCKNCLLAEKDMYGLPVRTVLCVDCDFVYTNPRLDSLALQQFYEIDYKSLDRDISDISEYFSQEKTKGQRIYQFILDNGLLDQLAGKLIVDIGCGAGGVIAYFRDLNYQVVGCDLSPENLNYAKHVQKLDVHYGGLETIKDIINEKSLKIGLVIYEQVLEHLSQPQTELASLQHILDSDSLVYIGVPGLRNIDNSYDSDFLRYIQIPHLLCFDLASLKKLMIKSQYVFVAGDETVRALFKPEKDQLKLRSEMASLHNKSGAILEFLMQLEERYQSKLKGHRLRYFLGNAKYYLKCKLEDSLLPPFIKHYTISLSRRVLSLYRSCFFKKKDLA
ncbi:MAG: ubiG 4 [Gammaproteobacteria bacterium]|jgi:SAM-dependent methyltransferase|nr:ubiG 4 [Gammaproteobacteria bacterium]